MDTSVTVLLTFSIIAFLICIALLTIYSLVIERRYKRLSQTILEMQKQDYDKANTIILNAQKQAEEIIEDADLQRSNMLGQTSAALQAYEKNIEEAYKKDLTDIENKIIASIGELSKNQVGDYANIIQQVKDNASNMLNDVQKEITEKRQKMLEDINQEVALKKNEELEKFKNHLVNISQKVIKDVIGIGISEEESRKYITVQLENIKQEIQNAN